MFGKRKAHRREVDNLIKEISWDTATEEKVGAIRTKVINREYMRYVNKEQGTKNAIIEPFIRALGFHPSDARSVQMEYRIGGKKVDYALCVEDMPVFLIEAKSHDIKLDASKGKYIRQIENYFNNVPAIRLALLTNGLEYRFYANDFETTATGFGHLMASSPFLAFNIASIKHEDIQALNFFTQMAFNPEMSQPYLDGLHKATAGIIASTLSDATHPALIKGLREASGITNVISDVMISKLLQDTQKRKD